MRIIKDFVLGGFLVLVFVVCGCSEDKTESDTIKIGINSSKTGDRSSVGIATENAAQMKIDAVNAAGGITVGGKSYLIELVFKDNESTQDDSILMAGMVELINTGVLAVVGPQASVRAIPGGQACQENEVPMVSPWSTNPSTTLNRPYVFRACFLDPFQGVVVANFVSDPSGPFGFDKAAVLYDSASDYPVGLAENFTTSFEDINGAGSVVESQTFTTGDLDFTTQLTAINNSDASVLFVPQYAGEVALIVEQAIALNLTQVIFGGDAWGDTQLLTDCGANCEGLYFSTHYVAAGATGATASFIDQYNTRFGEIPSDVAALTWDALGIVLEAIGNTGGLSGDLLTDRTAVKNQLALVQDYEGITGLMTFTETGDPIKCAVIVKIVNGEFTYYDSACPAD